MTEHHDGRRRLLRLTLLGAAAVLLASCGRKGSILPPEGEAEKYTYPQTYPDPNTVVPNYDGNVEPAPGETEVEPPAEPGFRDPEDELNIENE